MMVAVDSGTVELEAETMVAVDSDTVVESEAETMVVELQ